MLNISLKYWKKNLSFYQNEAYCLSWSSPFYGEFQMLIFVFQMGTERNFKNPISCDAVLAVPSQFYPWGSVWWALLVLCMAAFSEWAPTLLMLTVRARPIWQQNNSAPTLSYPMLTFILFSLVVSFRWTVFHIWSSPLGVFCMLAP